MKNPQSTTAVIVGGPFAGAVVRAPLPSGDMVRIPLWEWGNVATETGRPMFGAAECRVVWREDVMELHWPLE